MPRTHKLDDNRRGRLLRLVLAGATVADAAAAVGCCVRTVRRAAARDALFAWRLRLARAARDELHRRELDAPLQLLSARFAAELRREWGLADAGDTTPNHYAA